jgi:hypothetical protein
VLLVLWGEGGGLSGFDPSLPAHSAVHSPSA